MCGEVFHLKLQVWDCPLVTRQSTATL